MLETIKSYLISLGFAVNDSEFNKVQSAMNDLNKTVVGTTTGMIKNFAVAGSEVVGSLAAITGATAALVKQTAELDMGYQKFALRMWMTNDSAKDLQVTLKAMGESVEDVAWIPELRQQYYQLLSYGNQMKTPGDAGEQLKYIRSIMFEFTRMKLEVSYAAEWISYYLIKYLSGPLAKAKQSLQDFNDAVVAKMPDWTNKIAKVLSMIVTLTINVGRFIGDIYNGFVRFFDMMPRGMKLLIGALAGLTLAAKMNPILLLLSSALLLIDDFYAYMDGRKSLKSLQPVWGKLLDWSRDFNQKMQDLKPLMQNIWEQMVRAWTDIKDKIKDATNQTIDLWGKMKQSETYKNMIDVFAGAWDGLKNAIQGVLNIFSQFSSELLKSMDKRGVLTSFNDMIGSISHALDVTTTALDNLMIKFNLFSKDTGTKNFLTWMADQFAIIVKNVFTLGEVLGHVFSAMIKAGVGDLKGAASEMATAASSVMKYNVGGIGGWLQDKMRGGTISDAGEWTDYINKASAETGVDPALIKAVMMAESGGNANAMSSVGAIGLMQLIPDTAEMIGVNPYDPYENILGGALYLKTQLENFGGDASKAIAAYNAGPGAVQKYGGIPPYEETQNYVQTVLGNYSDYQGSVDYSSNNLTPTAFNMMRGNYSVAPIGNYVSSSDGGVIIEGGINISFGDTTASVNDIKSAVIQGIQQATGRQVSRQSRDLQGVIV